MELEHLTVNDEGVRVDIPVLDDLVIKMKATHISQSRTGLHAKVYLGVGNSLSAYSYFNVERDEDRGRLANSAHRKYPEVLAALYTRDQLKNDLD